MWQSDFNTVTPYLNWFNKYKSSAYSIGQAFNSMGNRVHVTPYPNNFWYVREIAWVDPNSLDRTKQRKVAVLECSEEEKNKHHKSPKESQRVTSDSCSFNMIRTRY